MKSFTLTVAVFAASFFQTAYNLSNSAYALPGDIVSETQLYTPHSGSNDFAWLHNHLIRGEQQVRTDSCIKGTHVVFDRDNSRCSLQQFKRCDGGYSKNLEFVQDLPLSACSGQLVDHEISQILSSTSGIGESKLQFGNYQCIQFCDAKDAGGNRVQVKRELSFTDPACTNSDLPEHIKAIVANTEADVLRQFESATGASGSGISVSEITNCSSSLEERDSGFVH